MTWQLTAETYRIAAIDDHPLILGGYHGLEAYGFPCAFDATSVEEFIALGVTPADVDLVILDVKITGENIADNAQRLVSDLGFTVAVVTSVYQPYPLNQALSRGVSALIAKNDDLTVQLDYMRQICRGSSDTLMTPLMAQLFAEAPVKYTEREEQVVRAYVTDMTTSEVAGYLYIAEDTVKQHVKSIKAKYRERDNIEGTITKERLRRLAEDDGVI